MRIAIVSDCYWPRVNGVSVSVQTYRDELERLGHEVIILCPEYPKSSGVSTYEASVRRFRSMSNPSSPRHFRASLPNVKLASLVSAPRSHATSAWPASHDAARKVTH